MKAFFAADEEILKRKIIDAPSDVATAAIAERAPPV